MQIVPTGQSSLPPPDKPLVQDPVKVTMDIPLFYVTERGLIPWQHSIFCSRAFADTVLQVMNVTLGALGLGMGHIGFYAPRQAKKKDGSLIQPVRWSNHAYGEAVDWKGIMTANGEFRGVDIIHDAAAMDLTLLREIWGKCGAAIMAIGRKPEIVSEGSWIHIGLWPKERK